MPAQPERGAASPERRRTQAERREGTIRKLLDAAAETLIQVGYARATVQEISARAGVSQGGLFRHFTTRDALIEAVAEDVGRRLLEEYRAAFVARPDTEPALPFAIRLLRAQCRSRTNQVWFELTMAARTHESLRRALAPVAERYHRDIESLAREVAPALAARLGADFPLLLEMLLSIFDGEVLHEVVLPPRREEQRRLELVLELVSALDR